ncbi:toxin-antitoxin system YwqK family antitoxin [Tenacibaculum piscium]|uniref:toxin-antitoxin system YwqK family antitoxin n=1 Tax=Tenacibaculum piscium TaxID=1458515 RepID=UPI001EFC2A70|nr:hypothetical protein [Tenacibaculum piscium]MCG8184426.1 hypothetical protein [Tenacibaculum piscium]MCG8205820.1 hypothetical protein [Tenacibaculum piscium]
MNLNGILIILLFICQISFGQKLTLNNIENICTKSNWESVNQFLINKNWEYYESEKGNSEKYSTITWSFNKSYEDKASAWLYLYTYEGFPNKISYSVFNKPSYSVIQKSLNSKGYKLQNSEIEDNELISTYANNKFLLKITTEKREKKDSYSSFDQSITAYQFLLIKKSSIYDPDNGKKTDYYYGDTKQTEYTMVNGEMNGSLKVYYKNGQLKKTGNYKNGSASGKFTEYDENGNKTYDYNQENDKKNGKLISYKNNKISYSTHYKDDIQNGERIEYYYDNESGRLYLKMIGTFLNGKKEGNWKLIFIDKEKGERTLKKITYSKGLKNGFSQDIKGDSLIIANYSNDKLDGNYKVYLDVTKTVFGGVIETDISKLFLLSEGKYQNDKKSDYWKYYSLTKSLSSEGSYLNDEKTGEWKNYYSKYSNDDKPIHYSEKLYLIDNYNRGKLNGLSTRFSYLNKEKYKCSELDKNNKPRDSCTRMVYKKVLQKSNYKNNKLDGEFELKDSLDILVAKGNFANDQKVGKWFHHYKDEDYEGNPYSYFMEGSYEDNEREGEWIYYYKKGEINKTINYKNGEFNGKFTEWNNLNKPKEIKRFDYGKFKELIVYDSIGEQAERKFEIFDEYSNQYKCRITQYLSTGTISQVYWLKKEKEISHNWFELSFILKLKKNDKSLIYKDGEFKEYDINNRPLIIGEYFEENKIGDWIYYYYPQKVKIEIEYDKNKNIAEKYLDLNDVLFSGEFKYVNEEDNIKEIRKIKNGLRNGNTKFINLKTGKRIKKVKYKNGKIK